MVTTEVKRTVRRRYSHLSNDEFLKRFDNDPAFQLEVTQEMVMHWLVERVAQNVASIDSFEHFKDECWELCGAIGHTPSEIWSAANEWIFQQSCNKTGD